MDVSQDLKNELGAILASDDANDILQSVLAEVIGEDELKRLLEKQTMKSAVTLLTPVIKELREQNTVKLMRFDKHEIKLDPKNTHAQADKLIMYLKLYKQAMIVGPTGSGKSTLAKQAADAMGLDYAAYSCNEEASKTELIGFNDLSGYNQPNFLTFYENGGVLLIDEYDAMSPGMALVLNAAFDRSGQLSVPTRKSNPIAKKHKDFYCILAGNTWGHASVEYSGRDLQDRAFLDRFKMCRIFIDYDRNLEQNLVGAPLAKFFDEVRKKMAARSIDDEVSTRTIVDSATLIANDVSLTDIIKAMTLHWEKDDVTRFMKDVSPAISLYEKNAKIRKESGTPIDEKGEEIVKEAWT